MSKSREQLVLRALQELRVVGAGQAASAEDNKVVGDEIAPVMSDLAARQVWGWGDADNLDDEAFVHLAKILANSVAPQFGMAPDEQTRLMAEMRLRQLSVQSNYAGGPQMVEYY